MIGTPLTAMKWDLCGTPLSFDISTPTLRESAARLAERARAENWSHEEYLAACLQREVSARESHSGEARIRAPGSRRENRWRSSTSTMPAASNATPSPTSELWISSPQATTLSSSAVFTETHDRTSTWR